MSSDGARRSAYDLLGFPDGTVQRLALAIPALAAADPLIAEQIAREALYAQYEDRQRTDIDAVKRDDAARLPDGMDFHQLSGLSREIADKLHLARPQTLGQAARMEGMTPAALVILLAHIRRARQNAVA